MDATNYIITATISYILGIMSGIFIKERFIKESKVDYSNSFVLSIVTLIWAVSMLYDIMTPEYETSAFVHGLMGAIVGFFYSKAGGEKK